MVNSNKCNLGNLDLFVLFLWKVFFFFFFPTVDFGSISDLPSLHFIMFMPAFYCNLQGYHGDTSATFFCGNVDDEARKLVQVVITTSIHSISWMFSDIAMLISTIRWTKIVVRSELLGMLHLHLEFFWHSYAFEFLFFFTFCFCLWE